MVMAWESQWPPSSACFCIASLHWYGVNEYLETQSWIELIGVPSDASDDELQ